MVLVEDITQNGAVGVANMRDVVYVVDWGSYVKILGHYGILVPYIELIEEKLFSAVGRVNKLLYKSKYN